MTCEYCTMPIFQVRQFSQIRNYFRVSTGKQVASLILNFEGNL